MQTANRGTKRMLHQTDWLQTADSRRSEHQFWKRILYETDAFVYESATPKEWIHKYYGVPSQFIVKFHDLVHPAIVDRLFEEGHLSQEQYTACEYKIGYPSSVYFGGATFP